MIPPEISALWYRYLKKIPIELVKKLFLMSSETDWCSGRTLSLTYVKSFSLVCRYMTFKKKTRLPGLMPKHQTSIENYFFVHAKI